MGRRQKKYHFIYKTTNIVNEKYYIGMHSTDDLNDGYIGSGKKLWYSIKKYGKENFKIEYLEFFKNRKLLIEAEKKIVNNELIKDPLCLNLKLGGTGGLINEEHAYNWHAAGGREVLRIFGKRHNERMRTDLEYREKIISKISSKLKNQQKWLGKKHKEISKRKIGEANSKYQQGSGNSQFGTCWITNGVENKKIKKDSSLPDNWKFGRTILKNKGLDK